MKNLAPIVATLLLSALSPVYGDVGVGADVNRAERAKIDGNGSSRNGSSQADHKGREGGVILGELGGNRPEAEHQNSRPAEREIRAHRVDPVSYSADRPSRQAAENRATNAGKQQDTNVSAHRDKKPESSRVERLGEGVHERNHDSSRQNRKGENKPVSPPASAATHARPQVVLQQGQPLDLLQKFNQLEKRLKDANTLEEVLPIAAEWDAAFREWVANNPASYSYLSDRDMIAEALLDELKDLGFQAHLKAFAPGVVVAQKLLQLWASIPHWVSIASAALEASKPSATATSQQEMATVDQAFQRQLYSKLVPLLPSSLELILKRVKIELPVKGASIRRPM